MHGDNGNGHLSLKKQRRLITSLVRAKRNGEWDQDAADTIGHYMQDRQISRMAIGGVYAELERDALYVAEVPIHEYGLAGRLYIDDPARARDALSDVPF